MNMQPKVMQRVNIYQLFSMLFEVANTISNSFDSFFHIIMA